MAQENIYMVEPVTPLYELEAPLYWVPRNLEIPIPIAALMWNQSPDVLIALESKIRLSPRKLACFEAAEIVYEQLEFAIKGDKYMSNSFSVENGCISFEDQLSGQSGQIVSVLHCDIDRSICIFDFAQYLYGIRRPVIALGRTCDEAVGVMEQVYRQELNNPTIQMKLIPPSLTSI